MIIVVIHGDHFRNELLLGVVGNIFRTVGLAFIRHARNDQVGLCILGEYFVFFQWWEFSVALQGSGDVYIVEDKTCVLGLCYYNKTNLGSYIF